jgi:uncharacterized membrane protein YkvA (DUF1232 family)
MRFIRRVKYLIKRFIREIGFYRRVLKHPETPLVSKILLGAAIAYALSPIDIIPDFIPVVGHIDDLVILPLIIWLAIIFIPKKVIAECRGKGRS